MNTPHHALTRSPSRFPGLDGQDYEASPFDTDAPGRGPDLERVVIVTRHKPGSERPRGGGDWFAMMVGDLEARRLGDTR